MACLLPYLVGEKGDYNNENSTFQSDSLRGQFCVAGRICPACLGRRVESEDHLHLQRSGTDSTTRAPSGDLRVQAGGFPNRDIVQVFSQNERHLYGTFLAIPDERLRPAGKPIITFDETPAGSPEAVRAWFYPGENYGHQFVYPKDEAVSLAKSNNTPVPSMPVELAVNTTKRASTMNAPQVTAMKQAPLKAQSPNGEELEIAEVFEAPDPVQTAQAQVPATLPATGSPFPLIGLAGLFSLGAALGLRFAAAKAR